MEKLELEDVLPHQWDEWTGRGPDECRGRVDWEGTRLLTRPTEAAMPVYMEVKLMGKNIWKNGSG